MRVPAALLLALCFGAGSLAAVEPEALLSIEADSATVGDALQATLRVELGPGSTLDPLTVGPRLGDFSVLEGHWDDPSTREDGGESWSWRGRLAAYKTGELEIPAIRVAYLTGDQRLELSTEPILVTVSTVLSDEDRQVEQPEIADLKPPASMRAELGPLWTGLSIVAALLVVAAVYWWLHRRYAARLAAAEVPDDPFHRTPPHVWVYGELQKLLEKRLPERAEVDRFYAELGRILKRYLGGRFRVDLLEHTTAEVPGRLRQAGGAEPMIQKSREILAACDSVKFAGVRPDPEQCRLDVEKVYEIVDATKPREVREDAARGAA